MGSNTALRFRTLAVIPGVNRLALGELIQAHEGANSGAGLRRFGVVPIGKRGDRQLMPVGRSFAVLCYQWLTTVGWEGPVTFARLAHRFAGTPASCRWLTASPGVHSVESYGDSAEVIARSVSLRSCAWCFVRLATKTPVFVKFSCVCTSSLR